jgi:hypothetical protein
VENEGYERSKTERRREGQKKGENDREVWRMTEMRGVGQRGGKKGRNKVKMTETCGE